MNTAVQYLIKLVLMCFLILNSAIAFGQYAEFSFDQKIAKFDPVSEGEIIQHTFQFTNTGDEPLIITKYDVECSCTKAEYSLEPVLPGNKGSIEITFDTDQKMGWQYRKILLYANTKKSPTSLEIRVKVLND